MVSKMFRSRSIAAGIAVLALGLAACSSGDSGDGETAGSDGGDGGAITVGFSQSELDWCSQVEAIAEIDNDAGVDNDEQGAPVMLCSDVTEPWPTLWPDLRVLG